MSCSRHQPIRHLELQLLGQEDRPPQDRRKNYGKVVCASNNERIFPQSTVLYPAWVKYGMIM